MYQRKTKDFYEILGCYNLGYEVVTTEETWKEAKHRIREYRENEVGTSFKIVKKRELITKE